MVEAQGPLAPKGLLQSDVTHGSGMILHTPDTVLLIV